MKNATKLQTITSAANPLLKDVRRALARGAATEEGWCVAETFRLLEEALRSDCDVKTVLAAESVLSAVEAHVGKLARLKVADYRLANAFLIKSKHSERDNAPACGDQAQRKEWKPKGPETPRYT